MIKKEEIIKILKECYDPEISVNIVDLGLIYDIAVRKSKISIKMTLTSLGCPLSGVIVEDIKQRILALKGVENVDVQIVFDPPWTPDRMSAKAKQILGM